MADQRIDLTVPTRASRSKAGRLLRVSPGRRGPGSRRGLRPVVLVAVVAVIASLLGVPAYAGKSKGSKDSKDPKLATVVALSTHRLLATFDKAPKSSTLDPAKYVVTDAAGNDLDVTALSTLGGKEALVTTAAQSAVAYEIRGPAANATPVAFTGSTDVEPALEEARSTGPTKVELTFSEPMGPDAADKGRYAIVDAATAGARRPKTLSVSAAVVGPADASRVTLTTSSQAAVSYRVTVATVRGQSGEYSDPARATAEFLGDSVVNTGPPRLLSARPLTDNSVILAFDRAMDIGRLADTANYAITPGLSVSRAEPQAGFKEVVLVTDLHFAVPYTVTTSNLVSTEAPPRPLDPGARSAAFTGARPIDNQKPRVTSAASTGNTTVKVQFSKPMADNTANPGKFVIQPAAGGAGVLGVTGARLVDGDRLSVELTTRSQGEIDYRVTVNDVTDLAGNPLDTRTGGVGGPTDPTSATFPGTPASGGELIDSDGDTLSDSEETQGYAVAIRLATGATSERQVTSDPDNADTDGDGLDDFVEKSLVADPRDRDTDDDGLSDAAEFNELFSDPTTQDSDGDTVTDGSEVNFFRTSPILDDTDGDQISDGEEITLGNRNAKVADLPKPSLEIGEMNLNLDVRFFESTSKETRQVDSRTVSASLEQSADKQFSNTDSRTLEAAASLSTTIGYGVEVGVSATPEVTASFNFEATAQQSFGSTFTSEFTESSAVGTAETYQESLTTEAETADGATVSREVAGARVQTGIMLQAAGDVAFNVSNLQVSALIQDPQDPTKLTPVATLLPDAEPAGGFNLGPLQPERGPVIFSSDQVFPQVVEDLMRNPRGLIFRFSNFDITDELGRNFAFTSQDINDRTAGLVIDFGGFDSNNDGQGDDSELNRVATGIGRRMDTNGDGAVTSADRYVNFDAEGNPVGITLRDSLQAIGLTQYDEDATPTATLTQAQIDRSYSVIQVDDSRGGTMERIWRIRRTALEEGKAKQWEIITDTGIDRTLDLDDYILQPGTDITIGFVQDIDQDGLIGLIEALNNCSDVTMHSDGTSTRPGGDGLDDRFEILIGWKVDTERGSIPVHSRCASEDTDGDGLSDFLEAPGSMQRDDRGRILFGPGQAPTRNTSGVTPPPAEATPAQVLDHQVRLALSDTITDPTSPDTDLDSLGDAFELVPYRVDLLPRTPFNFVVLQTSPEHFDSDGDTASDGVELLVGGNARSDSDRDLFRDDDGDGLVNVQETSARQIKVTGVSISPAVCDGSCDQGVEVIKANVTSNPNNADTDGDGLSDREESDLRIDPRARDTDGDGVGDFEEVRGFVLRDLGIITTSPTDADSDDDKRSDGAEADRFAKIIVREPGKAPYQAFTDPAQADGDLDRLVDGEEEAVGTDPGDFNTDGDNRSDYDEVIRAGRRPLVPDLRVTVNFAGLLITDASDGSSPGNFGFEVGVTRPNGDFTRAGNHGQTDYGLPNCGSGIPSLCRAPDGLVLLEDGDRLDLSAPVAFGTPSITMPSVSTTNALYEEFSIAGFVQEYDNNPAVVSCDAKFPDASATPADPTDPASMTVAGTTLKTGPQEDISFGQEAPCRFNKSDGPLNFTLQVTYRAE